MSVRVAAGSGSRRAGAAIIGVNRSSMPWFARSQSGPALQPSHRAEPRHAAISCSDDPRVEEFLERTAEPGALIAVLDTEHDADDHVQGEIARQRAAS